MKKSMLRGIKRSIAVALALMIGGSGCYALGNVSRAAEYGDVPGTIESEAEEQIGNEPGTGESADHSNTQENGVSIGDMQDDDSVEAGQEDSVGSVGADNSTESGSAASGDGNTSESGEDIWENGEILDPGSNMLDGDGQPDGSSSAGDGENLDSGSNTPDGDEQPDGSGAAEDGDVLDFGSDTSNGNELPDSSSDARDENESVNGSGNGSMPEDSTNGTGDGSAADDKEDTVGTGGDVVDMPSDFVAEEESGSVVNSSEEDEDTEAGQETAEADEMAEAEAGDALGLEVPEKINLTLDPYEIDGKGQVYSDEYVIRNAGKTKGKLTLYNFVCIPYARGEVIVQSARDGIYDSESKAIYLEMKFGNGEAVVFTEDGSGIYEIELEPGEELSMYFTGALSESSIPNWNSGDISVAMSYQWDCEDGLPETEDNLDNVGGAVAEGDTEDGTGSDAEGEEGLYSEVPEPSEEISDVSAAQDVDEAPALNPEVGKEANGIPSGETWPVADAGTEQKIDSETKAESETVVESNSETDN